MCKQVSALIGFEHLQLYAPKILFTCCLHVGGVRISPYKVHGLRFLLAVGSGRRPSARGLHSPAASPVAIAWPYLAGASQACSALFAPHVCIRVCVYAHMHAHMHVHKHVYTYIYILYEITIVIHTCIYMHQHRGGFVISVSRWCPCCKSSEVV